MGPLRELLDEKNLQVIKEQLNSPCVEEVAAFDKFIEFMDDPQYDVVIFDTAPRDTRSGSWSSRAAERNPPAKRDLHRPGASLQSAKAKYEKAISYPSGPEQNLLRLRPETRELIHRGDEAELRRAVEAGDRDELLIVNGILPEEACTDDFFRHKKGEEEKIVERSIVNFPHCRRFIIRFKTRRYRALIF